MKKTISIVGILTLIGLMAVPVMAYGPRGEKGQRWAKDDCPRYQGQEVQLTAEQQDQMEKLHQQFIDKTAQTRTDLMAKRSELRILMQTSNPDGAKAIALVKEISDLQGALAVERVNYRLEARAVAPDARLGWGYGPHHDRKGFGPGRSFEGRNRGERGPGARGGFSGPGACWR